MSEPFKDIVAIDRIVHEPARLALLLALDLCVSADFKYLQARTGLSDSNLSVHLTKLESHGLITIEKIRRSPRTIVRITKDGKAAMRAWRKLLEKASKPLPIEKVEKDGLVELRGLTPDPAMG